MADDPDATRDESVPVDAPTRPAPPLDGGADDLVIPAERYVAGSEIARGGMGRVVEARDTLLGRSVAMKAVLGNDLDARRRFARETRITARLEHPAIVPVYDAGKLPDGAPYIVMRKVSGKPLATVVASTATLAKRLGLLVHVLAAANAVAHAHRRGVLHRDLKPANILVGEFGETVVIDWGLAKVVGEDDPDAADPVRLEVESSLHTRAGAVFGTPGFMSPEQLAGEAVDARSDVYALGATLYFLLATHPPHHGGTAQTIMDRAASGPAAPIAEVVEGVPQDLAWIVDKALAYDPAQRYADAGEFAADLQAFTTGQLVASRRYSARERLGRFVARHRAWVIAVAVLVVLGIAGSILAVRRIVDERAATENALREANAQLTEQLLQRAHALIPENPTAAAALAKLVTDPARWREVRALGAEARAAGAAIGIPGPFNPHHLVLSRGGRLAVSADFGGDIWRHDLDRRTSEVLVNLGRDSRIAFAGDRIVAWNPTRLLVFDRLSASLRDAARPGEAGAFDPARRELAHVHRIASIAATPESAFVVGDDGSVERIDLASGLGTPLPFVGVRSARAAPDDRTVALAADEGLILLDARTLAAPPALPITLVDDLQWQRDGELLVVRTRREIVVVRNRPQPAIEARTPDAGVFGARIDRGRVYALVADSLREILPETHALLRVDDQNWSQIEVSRNGAIAAVHGQRRVAIYHDLYRLELVAPDAVLRLAASPTGPYVIGAIRGRVMVWNLEAIMPAQADVHLDFVAQANDHEVIYGVWDGWWTRFDLVTRESTPFRIAPNVYSVFTSAHGTAVFWPVDGTTPYAMSPRTNQPIGISGGAHTTHVEDDAIIFGSRGGIVGDFDPLTRTGNTLAKRTGTVIQVGAAGTWRSAMWDDGTLWRRDVATGREDWTTTARWSWQFQMRDGRVCGAIDKHVWCWARDGAVLPVAKISMVLDGLLPFGEHHAVAYAESGAAFRVDLDGGDVVSITDSSTSGIALSAIGNLGFVATAEAIEAVDLDANRKWRVARVAGVRFARLTANGSFAVVVTDHDHLLWWRLNLPSSQFELAAWLDSITNATTEQGTATLLWN